MFSSRVYDPAFLLFQLATATLFLRPAELFEPLAEMQIYEGLMLGCLAFSFNDMQHHFSKRMLCWQPVTLCVVGVLLGIVMSHLTHLYIGGISDGVQFFAKTLLYYGLLLTVVNSQSRVRAFMGTVAVCGITMVSLCMLDFWEIQDFKFIEQLSDFDKVDDEGEVLTVLRMRGTGIFQDPNDLAMVIVATGILGLYFLLDRSNGPLRWLWTIPLAMLAGAIICTGSRGGLLAGATGVFVLVLFQCGRKTAITLGVLAACALPFVGGRQTELDFEEGTGAERIELWRDGFDEIKSPDIVFGIGQGFFADAVGLVAHNSFVHAYVELGLFGGTMFFGAFFFAGLQLLRMGFKEYSTLSPALLKIRPYLAAVLTGWVVSMFSLSRCYVVPTYLILGMMAAYLNLVGLHTAPPEPLLIWNRWQIIRLTAASATTFVGLYAFTVIFA